MPDKMLIWMVLFGIFAVCFFVIAAYVSVTGVADVKALLTRHVTSDDAEKAENK